MVGQQLINNLMETIIPLIMKRWRSRSVRKTITTEQQEEEEKATTEQQEEEEKATTEQAKEDEVETSKHQEKNGEEESLNLQPQWENDYKGERQTQFSLFWEYLEIVLQYGFVTMFVAGFPLAPLFALLNNIAEIRVDAYNYVSNSRRPVAQRAEDIGAWENILVTLTTFSVLVNAFLLAFSSQLIPGVVYRNMVSPTGTMEGYLDWSLSHFNINDFSNESRPLNTTIGGIPEQDHCRYPGFRESTSPYEQSKKYWMVLSARLAFVLVYVIAVLFVSWFIVYMVAEKPKLLKLTIKREKFLAKQAEKKHKVKTDKERKSSSVEVKYDDEYPDEYPDECSD